MDEIKKILDANEEILWQGRPNFKPFVLSGSVYMFFFGLFWCILVAIFVFGFMQADTSVDIGFFYYHISGLDL